MLVHRCDIYKFGENTTAGSYGAPGVTEASYPEVPTYANVPCLFSNQYPKDAVDWNGTNEPGVNINTVYVVNFMKDEDVGLGDIVEWGGNKYILDLPYQPGNHHTEVVATRYDG